MKLVFISIVFTISCNIKVALTDDFDDLIQKEWNSFKLKYNKDYSAELDESDRFKIFAENLKKINEHNQQYERGEVSYDMQINEHTDMTDDEVIDIMSGLNISDFSNLDLEIADLPENYNLPYSIDWSRYGAVTRVKHQGQCGSCWAFAAVGALESHYFRATKRLVDLSEQNLIDCSRRYGTRGCKGGWMGQAYQYVKDNRGIAMEYYYRYENRDNQPCRYNPRARGATLRNFVRIPSGREDLIERAIATVGPVAVALQITHKFRDYRSGVFYDGTCLKNPSKINHAMVLVGYGVDQRTGYKYWLAKNSWGLQFGNRGYVKMIRGWNNNCNIAYYPVYPIV